MHPSLSAVIFDLDGTLVDSNRQQVDAWLMAFDDHGYRVGRDRVEQAVGKGGDQLVADLLGEEVDQKDGDKLREAQPKHAMELFKRQGVKAFPRAASLLVACRERRLKTALATSSDEKVQSELLVLAGIDSELFDVRVTAGDVDRSKPHPDLLHATIAKLGVSPAECVNVGDTPWDCIAARRAGLVTIGLSHDLNDETTLRTAGARAVVNSVPALFDRLDELLHIASPRTARLTTDRIELLMTAALASAEEALEAGEAPIGAILAGGDGRFLAGGYNRLNGSGDRITHAEIVALHAAAGKYPLDANDMILVCTLEPCVMCLGAAMEAGVDTVLYGLRAPADGGSNRVTPPTSPESQMPRILGNILADRSRKLFERFLEKHPEGQQARFVRQLLAGECC
jgi:HAD superfamily hydrolase (TIGR01509 family)